MTDIAISRVHFPVTTLGPGRRVGIWLQGCSIRCPGCISADTWAAGRDHMTIADLVETIAPWLDQADGITISGGEPFDQPMALRALLIAVRERIPANVLVYSGYPFEVLDVHLQAMSGLIDALISDPYDHTAPQTLRLRGSDNQRLHCLTPLGKSVFGELRLARVDDRAFDMLVDDDGTVWLAGIPSRADWARITAALQSAGGVVVTSQDRSVAEQEGSAQ